MPRLYLFRITKVPRGVGRRVAILTKLDKDPELSKINQGEITNYFDQNKQPSDGVDYKGSIEISEDVYKNVIDKLDKIGKNPAMKLINEGGKFALVVNNEKIMLYQHPSGSRMFIEYPYVFIK